jgi:hypothetical protein
MVYDKFKQSSWFEAIADTAIAICINLPLNMLMLWLCVAAQLGVFTTSVVMTGVFTIVAIVRKVIVRDFFKKLQR